MSEPLDEAHRDPSKKPEMNAAFTWGLLVFSRNFDSVASRPCTGMQGSNPNHK
jgi:hypothetical protein